MIYILVNSETGRRIRWWRASEAVYALDALARSAAGEWYLRTARDDEMVNDYPPDEIPDAMGGHPVALMDDGGYLCEFCVADPFNPVHDARNPHERKLPPLYADGWGVIGWFNSADSDERVVCDHCNRVLNEGSDDG